MPIPGTRQISTNGRLEITGLSEFFSFCVKDIKSPTYLEDFVHVINDYLPAYVFSRDTLATHEDRHRSGLTDRTPLQRARKHLQITRGNRVFDSGEFGEFLLYLFAKEVKGAYKLATKIHARGSNRTTIPGRDNTFVLKDENENIYMLVGEAKAHPKSNDGLRDAQQDINSFWSSGKIDYEISLASTHIRSEMTPENAGVFEAYFIDDHEAHSRLQYKNIVFVGYSLGALTDLRNGIITDDEFCHRVSLDLQNSFTNQSELIANCPRSSIYCFVPFESINTARNSFAQINGLVV